MENQIAAHHPSLQDLVIMMAPSSEALVKFPQMNDGCAKNSYPAYQVQHPQLFAREHGGCREDFIPVQRSDPQHQQLFRKRQGPPHEADRSANPSRSSASNSNNLPHDYAVVAGPTNVGGYTGQGAVISVNDPFIGDPSAEFSLSQLWTIAGCYADSSLNTAEVGSQVYPAFHPSYDPLAPHLFIYWTRDAYQSTGCYNLDCMGVCPSGQDLGARWGVGTIHDTSTARKLGIPNPNLHCL